MKKEYLIYITSQKEWSKIKSQGYITGKITPNPHNINLSSDITSKFKSEYLVGIKGGTENSWKRSGAIYKMMINNRNPVILKIPINQTFSENILVREALFLSPKFLKYSYGKNFITNSKKPKEKLTKEEEEAMKFYIESTRTLQEYNTADFEAPEIWTTERRIPNWKIEKLDNI